MVALLAGALLYLWLQLRHYQRIDYSYLISQEERERQTLGRLASLEQLVGDLSAFDRLHRADLAEMLSSSQTQLEMQAGALREMLAAARQAEAASPTVRQVIVQPVALEEGAPPERTPSRRRVADPALKPAVAQSGTLLFLRNERQWDIAAKLQDGAGAAAISRELGISLHEVELVRSVIARRKSA
jgi:hypothetical protein